MHKLITFFLQLIEIANKKKKNKNKNKNYIKFNNLLLYS